MNSFVNSAREIGHFVRTTNGAIALDTTGSALLDLYSSIGALRSKSTEDIVNMFLPAYQEDALLASKLAFYARNVRGGLGERDTFRAIITALAFLNPEATIRNIHLIPEFGRWDDLYSLVGTPVETEMFEFLRKQLLIDLDAKNKGESISLCAKWMKSVNASNKETVTLGKLTAKRFGWSEKGYRKLLSSLRSYSNVVEVKMSHGHFNEIDYAQVPSGAMKKYRKSFKLRNPELFASYIKKVQTGEVKINSKTLFPYDIMKSAGLGYYSTFSFRDWDDVLEEQWKALPNYVEGENNILVMADTSGSMNAIDGLPMATSVGLAVYFAERNKGAFKDLFLTFSSRPEFVQLKGSTLAEKVSCIPSIVANTDLEKAFDLILNLSLENDVPQSDMPKSLIIITDMQFDNAKDGVTYSHYSETVSVPRTFYKSMAKKYRDAGYEMPTIIFWNVNEYAPTKQATKNQDGVILVSGHSASNFRGILSNSAKTPYDYMLEELSNPIYDQIVA